MNTNTPTTHELNPLHNPFLFAEHEVRTAVDERGEVWLCAKDVFEALGIAWRGAYSLKNHPENWVCLRYLRGQSGSGEVIFISEPAVYKVIFASRKPEAEQFANWVCEEVLPAIRRQGFFGHVSAKERLNVSRQIASVTKQLTTTRDAMLQAVLWDELRDLHNLIGRTMPNMQLLGTDAAQLPLNLK